MYRLEKAIRALKRSMDQEYEKERLRNQIEYEEITDKNR